eukprot:CAMPEP_0116997870 /NCGR_PEP_ID=MMETSP0472-20121206/1148_1 /TAXON_ID=693140 ORGANISM="Tiarina fusus, Strain LIS" /NCGR_SAMPLE_ID=MMETSP0472 /ASSEMBLY_ACC=CAM_ASM_000603 /LENGTH=658 /DNA_ID=CAMNT_0004696867 /DNA_START=84 /DNA_END=2061 /DNA_ORIENTATION=-
MMNDADLELSDVHDQLPAVEEYKASVGYKKKSSNVSRPDPSGLDSLSLVSNTVPDEDEEEHEIGSKYGSAPSKGYAWKYLLCTVGTLVIIVTMAVIIAKKTGNDEGVTTGTRNSEKFQDTVDFLSRSGVSEASLFDDEDSAQYHAAQWLAHKDVAKLEVPGRFNSARANTFIERYALATVYYALGGPKWTHQLNFLSEEHVCTWYEDFNVVNDEFNLFSGDFITLGIHGCKHVNEDLVPYSLFLPNNNLVGSLPDEVHVFDHMEVVSLHFNTGITGQIPEGLSKMAKLRHLAMQWCDLTGTIPSWIGNAKDLQYLGLGNNQLTGTVPASISQLTELQVLGLDDNDLEAFHTLSNLKSLYLEDNRIGGTISAALMTSWPVLQELDLSGNDLGGELPDNFFDHKNALQVVDLHRNNFEGTFPAVSAYNYDLEFLALQDNKFTGSISEDISKLKALRHLDLNMNDFRSDLPGSLVQMTQLEYLFLGGNSFTEGEIPGFLFELTNLRELSLKASKVQGTLPGFIGYLTNLEFLDLHFNSISGIVPSEIGLLTNLEHLLLKNNDLVGTLPKQMEKLSSLRVVLLEQNDFGGDASTICDNAELVHFAADCRSGIQCSCCDVCCDEENQTCNAGEWDGGLDPIWEYGYRRSRYSYDMGPHVVVIP